MPDVGEVFARSLYAQYAIPLLAFVRRLTGGDRQWAEDVVQETLPRAWQHADRLLPGRRPSLMPWLVTVARRIVINDWRTRGARSREVTDDVLAMVAVPDDIERTLQRQAVVEMFPHGRTIQEAAGVIGVPPGTVKSRVFTAVRAMRAETGCST